MPGMFALSKHMCTDVYHNGVLRSIKHLSRNSMKLKCTQIVMHVKWQSIPNMNFVPILDYTSLKGGSKINCHFKYLHPIIIIIHSGSGQIRRSLPHCHTHGLFTVKRQSYLDCVKSVIAGEIISLTFFARATALDRQPVPVGRIWVMENELSQYKLNISS